ncbi:MAG: glycosyltransferase, partial [Vicinamibacterales bacterium]
NALGLGLYPPIFRGVRAFMYNSLEERALIQTVANNQSVPGVVVGVGSDIPERSNAGRFRQKFDLRDRFAIYVGRIDENKGCVELFEFFEHYSASLVDGMHLVLIGTPHVPIPKHPRIHHLGFLEDQDKYDAMAASELLIMPSYLESLSMVALEAWAMGKPVLANAKCDVLQGQCLRSNAGLFYENYQEFAATMRAIDTTPSLQAALGRNGRTFFDRHYGWPVIEAKYVEMLQQLSKESSPPTMEAMPGWFTRRRRSQPPADDVVKKLPVGACRETGSAAVAAAPSRAARSQAPAPPETAPPAVSPRAPAESAPPQAPSHRPSGDRQRGQRDHRRDQRGPRPDNRRPSDPARQQTEGRGPKPEGDRRPQPQGGDNRQPKTPGDEQRAPFDSAQGKRDQRRGRSPRRGRQPGGGGGGGAR